MGNYFYFNWVFSWCNYIKVHNRYKIQLAFFEMRVTFCGIGTLVITFLVMRSPTGQYICIKISPTSYTPLM